MWFKNLIFYRFTEPKEYTNEQLETALQADYFTPCKSQELSRYGWIAPHSALDEQCVFAAQGAYLVATQKEEKVLPASVIKSALQERVELIEREQARKVYRKEQLQLKDEIILDLLPRAFSRFQQTHALIMPRSGLIVVDSATHKRAEELLSLLRNSLGTLPVTLPDVHHSPAVVMSEWLQNNRDSGSFVCLDECELKTPGDDGGSIRIKGQMLFSDEITAHIESGMHVTKLAVTWDDVLNLIIQEDLSLKRVKPTEELSTLLNEEASEDPLARLDSDISRLALECQKLYPQLLDTFGGLVSH